MPPREKETPHWTLEKRVNLAFLIGLGIQTCAFLAGAAWYSAKVDARLIALENTDVRIFTERDVRRKMIDDRFDFLARDRERLIRLETQMENANRSLGRIENKLDTSPK